MRMLKIYLFLVLLTIAAHATKYTYNSAGQLVAESYSNGAHIFYQYDVLGNLLERQILAPIPNPQTDLSIAISVTAGEVIVATITVTNNGAHPAISVMVNDAISVNLKNATATSSQGAAEITDDTLVADLGTLPSGASATITITGIASGSTVLNFNPVVSAPEDVNAANNSATASVNIGPTQLADLSLAFEAGPDPAFAPGKLSFQAIVSNSGPTASAATTLTLTLPAGATFDSASHPATLAGNTVSLDLGAIVSGASVTALAKINPPTGNVAVTASLTTSQNDPDLSNNTASASVNVLSGTLTVTNNNDTGAGSLRQAISDANNNPGPDIITFDIPGAGIPEIKPTTRMPLLRDELLIDGFSQSGGLVEIDGSLINDPFSFGVLEMRGSEITVRGLVLNNHLRSNGIAVEANFAQDGSEFHELLSILGCLIGTEPDGITAAPNQQNGMVITDAESVQIGGSAFWKSNIISGNTRKGIDVRSSVLRDVKIINNYIGTDITGEVALPNEDEGIRSLRVDEVIIIDNVISGNNSRGLVIAGKAIVVQGNHIGTNATGTSALPNSTGVLIGAALESDVLIGGTFAGQGNLISGNLGVNLSLSGNGVTLAGNLIGPDHKGAFSLAPIAGPGVPGIEMKVDGPSFIGLPVSGGGNLISGNTGDGIESDFPGNFIIRNNRIGTTANGLTALPNSSGIAIVSADDIQIGGTLPKEGNIIGGNTTGVSLRFTGPNLVIQGNTIGLGPDGQPVPNDTGINSNSATFTKIGGLGSGAGNIIAGNNGHGVHIPFGTATILGNSIHSNGKLGINLGIDSEPTPNDLDDADTGANNFQNFPVIVVASTRVNGTLSSESNKIYRIEFFANHLADESGHGEGESFLGALEVITDEDGEATFEFTPEEPLPVGQFVTATASDPDGRTSEFGVAFAIEPPTGFVDSDGDGMSDAFELEHFGNITGGDPNLDPDKDGRSNFEEFIALTDPNDANSVFLIRLSQIDGNIVISVQTENGRIYQLSQSNDLQNFDLVGAPKEGNGEMMNFTITPGDDLQLFLRLSVTPSE